MVLGDVRVVVLATWRGGDPHREASWAFVRRFLDGLGYPVYVGESDPGPFNLSQAANRAAVMADADGRWDIAVIVGADCIIPREQFEEGIEHAFTRQVLTLPHDDYVRLTRSSSAEYLRLDGNLPAAGQARKRVLQGAQSGRQAPAGYTVMPRSVWDRIGGYDERFRGWGYEDAALLVSAGYFERLSGPIYHLWHPEGWKGPRSPEQQANYDLWRAEYWGRAPEWMLAGPGKLA